jgi:NADH-dependent peroxiredoxin subunit F
MSMYDTVIVGGGPAGLVAARYCLHAHLNAAIITPELGGKVNYPFALRDRQPTNVVWGAQLIAQFEQAVAQAPALPHIAQEVSKVMRNDDGCFALKLADGTEVEARSVILATGTAPQRLYVEGEKEFWGHGVSFSAVSHAPYFAGRDVAVVGGHRRTLIAALELAPIARQIYLIAALPQAMAQLPEAEKVLSLANVTPFIGWEVQAILGDNFVTGISLVGANGETRELTVDGVFVQMALLPNNEMIRDLVDAGMAVSDEGTIVINQRCETSVPGFFAAGDVSNIHTEQVLAAIGEGAKAALSAWEYLATHTH